MRDVVDAWKAFGGLALSVLGNELLEPLDHRLAEFRIGKAELSRSRA